MNYSPQQTDFFSIRAKGFTSYHVYSNKKINKNTQINLTVAALRFVPNIVLYGVSHDPLHIA